MPETSWGHRVAWSILVALGAMDSGSNPGDPIAPFFLCRKKSAPKKDQNFADTKFSKENRKNIL